MKMAAKKKIIKSFLIIIGILLFACKPISENINHITKYVVNTNSMKVHSVDCGSGKLISDKNKKEITDSIMNLCSQGYRICKNCNAGLSKKHVSLLYEVPTKREYLKAIDDIGQWYVNNIPTYWREIQEMPLSEYDGADDYIIEYNLIDKHEGLFGKKKSFKVISSNSNGENVASFDNNVTLIACANENAINNYKKSFNKIKFRKKLAYYDCDYIKDCHSYNKAGDDCVRFVFSIFNHMDKSFVYDIEKICNKAWNRINSGIFKSDTNLFVKAMQAKGFDVYDACVEKYSSESISNNKIIELDGSFKLKKGDIIVRDGHVHIFMDDYMIDADNFGWGRVNRFYPVKYDYSLVKIANNYYIICDHDKKENGKNNLYTRVYRYVGGIDEK